MHITLTPAYGRDYKNADEVTAAWNGSKDFAIQSGRDTGRYVNIDQVDALLNDGVYEVNIRYKKLRSVCVIKLVHKVKIPA